MHMSCELSIAFSLTTTILIKINFINYAVTVSEGELLEISHITKNICDITQSTFQVLDPSGMPAGCFRR